MKTSTKKIAELLIDYLEQLVRISSEELGIDLIEKFDTKNGTIADNRGSSGKAK